MKKVFALLLVLVLSLGMTIAKPAPTITVSTETRITKKNIPVLLGGKVPLLKYVRIIRKEID